MAVYDMNIIVDTYHTIISIEYSFAFASSVRERVQVQYDIVRTYGRFYVFLADEYIASLV